MDCMESDKSEPPATQVSTSHHNNEMATTAEARKADGLEHKMGTTISLLSSGSSPPVGSNTHHKLNSKLVYALIAMSFLWTGSQIPLYLFGGILPDIYGDIGGYDRFIWLVIGYLIPNAALCPFVGALSDLFGRKWVAIAGQVLLVLGPVVTSTAHNMNVCIAGSVISGMGAGINELIALAATAEMVPVGQRGIYMGAVVCTIAPFAPSVLYAQLISGASGSWRYVGIFVAGWNLIGLVLVVTCYHEPPRVNVAGHTKRQILERVDYVGGFLSTSGAICLMMGLQWSSIQYTWRSVHVIVPLILGILLIITFFWYEIYVAKHPMCPPQLFVKARGSMIVILLITFLSGANFIAMLLFWPPEVYNVYGTDRVGIGLRSLPIGFGLFAGAVTSLVLVPITKGRIKLIMICFTVLMTASTGAMTVARPDNMNTMYGIVTLASFGVGGVIVPSSIIAQILCPDELIATITAITLSARYIGGAIGFTIYFNVFYAKVYQLLQDNVGIKIVVFTLGYNKGIAQGDISYVKELVKSYAEARYADFDKLAHIALTDPSVAGRWTFEQFTGTIISGIELAFAMAYRWPYFISIAFGGVNIILACFLGDIRMFLDEHIAVPQFGR